VDGVGVDRIYVVDRAIWLQSIELVEGSEIELLECR
jgi:hypothetical protein